MEVRRYGKYNDFYSWRNNGLVLDVYLYEKIVIIHEGIIAILLFQECQERFIKLYNNTAKAERIAELYVGLAI